MGKCLKHTLCIPLTRYELCFATRPRNTTGLLPTESRDRHYNFFEIIPRCNVIYSSLNAARAADESRWGFIYKKNKMYAN